MNVIRGGFFTEETEEILERNTKEWNLCKRCGHIGGTQVVPAPIVQPLKGYASKVTSACGLKIYEFLFDKCGVLFKNVVSGEEILETTTKVWNLCKRSGHIGGTQAVPAPIVHPLKGCAGKVTSACEPKIYEFVFEKMKENFLGKKERKYWQGTANFRNFRSGHIGGTQPVPAPTIQPLTGCAGKVTNACEPKVYAFGFDKSGVLCEKCCELLLNVGRECHDGNTNSIQGEGEFSTEEKNEIMERHSHVWNLCKKNGHIDIKNTVL
ncbi:LOW QUALITY PROTEIN: hypothetical protein Cgig2_012654 [Carnegiea gigantea]|uniref:Prolamin-like domain-containing protein n=1 Tax=Carnegiea gigantea TaxID=171969 RepID=A0A9Q1K1J2_9CARY|nr:LOW QUALITY PROTEIN: hypothetical protein Cgig2_012654 [Carnegiea gigantea]